MVDAAARGRCARAVSVLLSSDRIYSLYVRDRGLRTAKVPHRMARSGTTEPLEPSDRRGAISPSGDCVSRLLTDAFGGEARTYLRPLFEILFADRDIDVRQSDRRCHDGGHVGQL